MPYGIVTIGPAGVGKTTMCHALQVHGQIHKRGIFVVNLDPAADLTPYEADVDVRELISVEDAMREYGYGPNGGLIYCMEYLLHHFDWLETKLALFGEDDTLLFDCPGQLELYTHVQVMPRLVRALQNNLHINCCATFLVDAVSINEPAKFVAGALAGLSAMLQLPIPHVTVLSKSDAIESEEKLEEFLNEGSAALFVENKHAERNVDRTPNPAYERLHGAICSVLDDHAMLSYVPFTIKDEEKAAHVLAFCDHLTMYSENAEVKIPREPDGGGPGCDADLSALLGSV
mmetsp:Transcript_12799/g.38119  ORF Transcript_12799/g.38119 Transcript_12799/m.38119 type:complete len:288 (+) Transcript_12799:305-1168(+)